MTILDALPWPHLGLAVLLCLVLSALGFRRVDWFISIGYGLSIAAQAVLFLLLYLASLDLWTALQVALLFAYGTRLAGYLIARERSPSFARELEASRDRGARVKGVLKLIIWISVSALYVAMFSPALLSLWAQAQGASLPSLVPGIAIMVLGLAIEAASDWQKSRLKAADPSRFTRTGLFGIVRYPSYFGEMLFWAGSFVSGISGYTSLLAWLVAATGLVCIELIMVGSARRLEFKQAERYGHDAEYQHYIRSVPVLIPFVPLYSVKAAKIYLG